MNPYDPPNSKQPQHDVRATTTATTALRSVLIPTFVGAVDGSIIFAPITRGPGDPTGHGIAFGLGGLISLIGAFAYRAVRRSTSSVPQDHNNID